jgi:kinesin family protein C1
MGVNELDDLRRKHRNEMEDMRDDLRRNEDRAKKEAQAEIDRLMKTYEDRIEDVERRKRSELEEERGKRVQEMHEVSAQLALHRQTAELENGTKDKELQNTKVQLEQTIADLEKEKATIENLKASLAESTASNLSLEASMQAMRAKIGFLESNSQSQSEAYAEMDRRMQEAIASAEESKIKLQQEETLRRKLHNQVQELKGNIRVFCRVRPPLGTEADETAKLGFPDQTEESKELVVTGPEQRSSLGTVTATKNAFAFDRVFGPASKNLQVFDEISQLVQSALDGYNVCIFCYGQTGSGKTYTMSSQDGMIPLAVHQIYDTATKLEGKGWKYTMEGSFVEVYNENLNDLLGKSEDLDRKKLEIRHDNANSKTIITNVETMMLDSPDTLKSLLTRADSNRSVAATKANMRSSRSHSVFILKLIGVNSTTGERSEGTLNLVDLAGSERLGHSQATGDRLKETQSINKSLSCLGDVIAALGQGKDGGHVPYRNSKVSMPGL